MKSVNFWSELGSGFGELGSTPAPGIPRNTPPGLRRSDPQPHRNISELTLSFLCGIWLIFVAKGPLVETKGCLLLGSDESLWIIISCGTVMDHQLHFWSFFFISFPAGATHSKLNADRQVYTYSTCLASNPLNPWGKGGLNKVLYWALPRGPNLYPFCTPFITFHWQIHIPSVELCIPFICCKMVFLTV